MKFWIDAQLPPQLAFWLNSTFNVEAISLRDLGLRDAQDWEIFQRAKKS
jgi:predicted nuclease of predicted toxin-antitoxin system